VTAADDYRESACTGKIPFSSFAQAQRVAERGTRRGRSRQVYRCVHCHHFHLGRRPVIRRRVRLSTEEIE